MGIMSLVLLKSNVKTQKKKKKEKRNVSHNASIKISSSFKSYYALLCNIWIFGINHTAFAIL